MAARSLLIAVGSLLVAAVVAASQSTYRVERVVDGDTVVLAGLGTVRLIGVDTPETVDPRRPVQTLGAEAAAFLTGLLAGQAVRVEYDQRLKDPYQRTLAYLYLLDGRLVNREIIRQGYGFVFTEQPFRLLEDFRAVEREARSAGRGLWAPAAVGLLSAVPPGQPATNHDQIVYATRTGARYHRESCRSLSQSKIPMTLKEAAARYGPCGICRPPTLSGLPSPVVATPPAPPRPASSAGRCAAITKAGTQCSRNASAGKSYCWQHGG